MRSHMDHSLCILFGIIWHRMLAAGDLTSLRPVLTSAGPTKYNRITVIDEKRTTVDFFASSKYRRDDLIPAAADIWNWDHWCHQQPKRGTFCKKNRQNNSTMYYYQPRLDRCETFQYRGCEGNKNQFGTKTQCERHCLGAGRMYQEKIDPVVACEMQPSGGVCLGYMTRMYFDINDLACKSFLYSGCGGNPNNFETNAECMNVCFENTKRKNKAAEGREGSGSDEDNW